MSICWKRARLYKAKKEVLDSGRGTIQFDRGKRSLRFQLLVTIWHLLQSTVSVLLCCGVCDNKKGCTSDETGKQPSIRGKPLRAQTAVVQGCKASNWFRGSLRRLLSTEPG